MAEKKDVGGVAKREKNRVEILKRIGEFADVLINEIDKGDNPHIDIPVRGSSNVAFDTKNKKIVLGSKVAKRYLFNVSHARRFMQTMLVASYVKKDLLGNNLTATLRDLYYAKKHTIAGSREDTIDEQKESDLAIVDFEVSLDTFREMLHLRAEPKGRMAGNMRIKDFVRDRESLIDLSKLGSGGLAIPSIVEQIEFTDYDLEYVLVAEKNAIFDRLNEDEYWRKNKCLLMTTAGQAARGARRLLQRLSVELKLPVFCLSVDADEPLMIIGEDRLIKRPEIGKFVDNAMQIYGITDMGYFQKSFALGDSLAVSKEGKAEIGMIVNAVRHEISDPLLEIETEGGYSARVTRSHSLKVFDSEKFEIVSRAPLELKQTDYIISASKAPNVQEMKEIDVAGEILENNGISQNVQARTEASSGFVPIKNLDKSQIKEIRWGKSEVHLQPKIPFSPELFRLLGYYASEGSLGGNAALTFGPHEEEYVMDASTAAERSFGVRAYVHDRKTSLRVEFGGKLTEVILRDILDAGEGAENKRIPWIVFNAPNDLKKEFIRGYFRGDGTLVFSRRGCRLSATTISRKLASDLVFLIHQLGGWASVNHIISKTKTEKDRYNIVIQDHKTLESLSETVMDKAAGKREQVWKYLQAPTAKLSIRKSVPSEIIKKVQKEIYQISKKGTSPLVNNQKRIAFERLEPLLTVVGGKPESLLIKDALLDSLPLAPEESLSTSEIAEITGSKFITAFKALKRMAAKGLVKGIKVKGDWRWHRTSKEPALDTEGVRKLLVLKNIVENGLVLLKTKIIIEIQPTKGMVYDIEVSPAHSFVTGIGQILVSNTDADPYGWYIYSTMKYGSMALAHESDRLGCKEMRFLGMSISDIEHYDLKGVTIKAKEVDIKRATEMKAYDWFKAKEWQKEIDKFLDKKIKAEIQSLSSKNLQYISNTYLPEKIKNQDFLP